LAFNQEGAPTGAAKISNDWIAALAAAAAAHSSSSCSAASAAHSSFSRGAARSIGRASSGSSSAAGATSASGQRAADSGSAQQFVGVDGFCRRAFAVELCEHALFSEFFVWTERDGAALEWLNLPRLPAGAASRAVNA